MKLKLTTFLLLPLLLAACHRPACPKVAQTVATPDTAALTLIGRKAVITFPKMKAVVTYLSDSTLHWETTDTDGKTASGDERMDYQRLTAGLHFLNWIEKDGWTVSQVIDTRAGTVKAFWSFADEAGTRGKRNSEFVDGTFKFAE